MRAGRLLVVLAFAGVLGLPFLVRARGERGAQGNPGPGARGPAPRLVVVTPHVEQIRSEFSGAFARWHLREYGAEVAIDWRVPGGTSDIMKQLEAQYAAAFGAGRIGLAKGGAPRADPGTVGFDALLGGGTYEHGRLKRGIEVAGPGGARTRLPLSVPAGFGAAELEGWFGENRIGSQPLYDPDQHWLGTALSGFGIVYNRLVLAELGLAEPRAFDDLTDPRYLGMLALADPRQSGSVSTAYESILSTQGWDRGWRTLREMCGNARYFASASTRPPIDVSQGEAAAGLCIDFYGRGQAQTVMRPGETPGTSRVGYVDPRGAVYIDADPVSILLGGPNPELARRFVRFCLSEEGQALWQFRATGSADGRGNPRGPGGEAMGPVTHELRRMPARRVMYEKYLGAFIDPVNPFELASEVPPAGWRPGIALVMGAMGIDTADECRAAWAALARAREAPGFPPGALREMEGLFYAMPPHALADGRVLTLGPGTFAEISADLGGWKHQGRLARTRIAYTTFFRDNYRRVVELARAAPAGG
ncbi:MAG TPA: extracellular solute-binding protein [Phycisphaerales bacterium]|nr:extracellular solute-binding protein [Phycisphaerales bacterium]